MASLEMSDGRLYKLYEPEIEDDYLFERVAWVFWDAYECQQKRHFSFAVALWLDEAFDDGALVTSSLILKIAREKIYDYLETYHCPRRRSQRDAIIRLSVPVLDEGTCIERIPLPDRKLIRRKEFDPKQPAPKHPKHQESEAQEP